MKTYCYWILVLTCMSVCGCDQATFIVTPQDTPIKWREDDKLYQSILYGKESIRAFNNTDSTVVIDKTGKKAFFKFEHNQGCINHQYEILIPSLAIKTENSQMPWIINHQHGESKCEVNVITRYTLDLESIPIINDWKINTPQIMNISEKDKSIIKVIVKE